MAVAALCATAVFGASLTHLVSTPALYGVPYQAYFAAQGPGSGAVVTGPLLGSLRRDRAIERITLAALVEVGINGKPVRALAVTAVRGPALISAVDGPLPDADQQIVLGAATMRTIGARPGGLVRVTVTDPAGVPHSAQFRVIGRASFPPRFRHRRAGQRGGDDRQRLHQRAVPAGARPARVPARGQPRPRLRSAGARRSRACRRHSPWPGTSASTPALLTIPESRPRWSTSVSRSTAKRAARLIDPRQ
jgi:hypothetical protein